MKLMKLLKISLLILFLTSCMPQERPNFVGLKDVTVTVRITKVETYKYSKVEGNFYFEGKRFNIDNGGTGYYHKKYSLKEGDTINTSIRMSYYQDKGDVIIDLSDLDVSKYEVK